MFSRQVPSPLWVLGGSITTSVVLIGCGRPRVPRGQKCQTPLSFNPVLLFFTWMSLTNVTWKDISATRIKNHFETRASLTLQLNRDCFNSTAVPPGILYEARPTHLDSQGYCEHFSRFRFCPEGIHFEIHASMALYLSHNCAFHSF